MRCQQALTILRERDVVAIIIIGGWLVALAAIVWLLWRSKGVF